MGKDGHYDCIVIGSGFGGAAMACRLAEEGRDVLVLERGGEYPPGQFPRTPLNVSTNLWDPSEGLYGMFDVWSFKKFEALVCSGVGGGSLIYANVMVPKPKEWFAKQTSGPMAEYWPINADDLTAHYRSVKKRLGVKKYPYVDTTDKTKLLRRAAESQNLKFSRARLAVEFGKDESQLGRPVGRPEDNRFGVQRYTCRKCGECDVGCNLGSKNSTDLTYLSIPELRDDPKTGEQRVLAYHEARQIKPLEKSGRGSAGEGRARGYAVEGVVHQPPDPRSKRHLVKAPKPFRYTATTVVLAAGCFGSTYLLLANRRRNLPDLSPALGTKFSGNGDYLGIIRAGKQHVVNSSRAPVITGMITGKDRTRIDLPWPESGGERGYLLQDGGYPLLGDWVSEAMGIKPVRRLAQSALALARARLPWSTRTQVSAQFAEAIGQSRESSTLLPILGIGRDLPGGVMALRELRNGDTELDVSWERSHSQPIFARIEDGMRKVAAGMDGEFLRTPSAWLSRMTSVHPLGGAPMSTDPQRGVVDEWGEVWNYEGLFVADGSVMPGSVGVNPAMTIAALAERFAERVLQRC